MTCSLPVFCQVKMPWLALLWATLRSNVQMPSLPSGHWKPAALVSPWTPTATQSRITSPLPRPSANPVRVKPRNGGSYWTWEAMQRS